MTTPRIILVLLWLLLGCLITGLTLLHPTLATSPDSQYYLRMATNWSVYDGTFPPGYPFLIGVVSVLTTLSGLWASKVVNWLTLGVFAWLWAQRMGEKPAIGLLAIWFLPGNLRVATYTWSETVFCVLLLETVWHSTATNGPGKSGWQTSWSLVAIALGWTRYIGFFLVAGLLISQFMKLKPRSLRRVDRRVVVLTLLALLTLPFLNSLRTGHPFGGPRLIPTEPLPDLIRMIGRAILNEMLLYNDHPAVNRPLWGLAFAAQLVGLLAVGRWFMSRPMNRSFVAHKNQLFIRNLWTMRLWYFVVLFGLRLVSPFDPLTERLMTPGSFCWLCAAVLTVQSQHSMMSRSPERAEMRTNPS